MKDEILANLDNPVQLEKLYRLDKPAFKKAFTDLSPHLKDNNLVSIWNARLSYTKEEISWGNRNDLLFVIIASVLAGVIVKLPAILHIDEEAFYTRNVGFIVLPALSAYFAWKNQLSVGKIAFIGAATLAGLVFINLLPVGKSDTLILSSIHLVLFLWSVLGFSFVGEKGNNVEKRLGYLSFNGDVIVMSTLILIAGAILSAVTVGLFSLISFQIKGFYFEYVAIFGLSTAPILGTYLTRTNPQLVGKVSPVIAKIFSPLVLVMLVIYLVAMIYTGKNPYNDREFLVIFNALLVGVMAIIFFSVAETSKAVKNITEIWVIFLLSVITVVVSCISLSAIVYRIWEGGITPNRAAVLGSNALILVNLLLVTVQLFRVLSKKSDISGVGKVISSYLPIYFVWTIIVTFLFPFVFGFK